MQKMASVSHYNIEGIWKIDTEPFGEPCILIITPAGRTIQFPTSVSSPSMNQTMRLWHSDYDGAQVRFRPSPSAEGWLRGVKPVKDGWIMTAERDGEHSSFHCVPMRPQDLPDWYDEMLEKNLKKMEQTEFENRQA